MDKYDLNMKEGDEIDIKRLTHNENEIMIKEGKDEIEYEEEVMLIIT